MTVLIANVDSTTDTFGQWVSKTNIIADALSNKVVSTNSNTATGNAAISGTFTANAYFGNTLSGGNTSASANLTVSSNVIFSQNVYFSSSRISLGLAANVQINGGNSSVRVLAVNTAASNTLVVTRLNTSDLSDFNVSANTANGGFLVYNSANGFWYSTNNVNFTGSGISVGNSSVNVTINSTSVAVNGTSTTLRVFYANNVQAFP